MNSDQQREYLAAMGIQVWVPRGLESASAQQEIDAETSGSPRLTQGEKGPLTGSAMVEETTNPAKKRRLEAELPQSSSAGTTIPRFQLSALLVKGVAVLLADRQIGASQDVIIQEDKLLTALGLALNGSAEPLPVPSRFHWPMFEQLNMDQSEPVAQAAVRAFFDAQTEGEVLPYLLLFGESCRTYLTASGQSVASLASIIPIEFPALNVMLKDPSAKRAVWERFAEILGT